MLIISHSFIFHLNPHILRYEFNVFYFIIFIDHLHIILLFFFFNHFKESFLYDIYEDVIVDEDGLVVWPEFFKLFDFFILA